MFILTLVALLASFNHVYAPCPTLSGSIGECVAIKSCPPYHAINKKRKKTDEELTLLRRASCEPWTLKLKVPHICCPAEEEWPTISLLLVNTHPSTNVITSGENHETTAVTHRVPYNPVTKPPAPTDDDIFRNTFAECPPTVKPPNGTQCCGIDSTMSGFTERIKGGTESKVEQFPWLAVLEYEYTGMICGGSLVSARYVLTAAHCLNTRPTQVRLSEYNISSSPIDTVIDENGNTVQIKNVVIRITESKPHPGYTKRGGSSVNDIGLVKLSRNAPITVRIFPICLPSFDLTIFFNEGQMFTVAGWGSNGNMNSVVKRHVDVPYVLNDHCGPYKTIVNERQICAGGNVGEDSCRGDSGGPLMAAMGNNFVLAGIVSFGPQECGSEKVPAVYTNVFKFIDWIEKEMT